MDLPAITRLIEECEQHPCAAPNVDKVADARSELNMLVLKSKLLRRLAARASPSQVARMNETE